MNSSGSLENRGVGLPRFRSNLRWLERLVARPFDNLEPGLSRIQLFSDPRYLFAIQKSRRSEPVLDVRQRNETAEGAGSKSAQVIGLTPVRQPCRGACRQAGDQQSRADCRQRLRQVTFNPLRDEERGTRNHGRGTKDQGPGTMDEGKHCRSPGRFLQS